MVRGLYAVAGLTCVGLGVLGIILPGMPSTVFFICALWAFKRSSAKLETWLLQNRVVGPTLRQWDEDRSMTRRAKTWAISMLWVAIIASVFLTKSVWLHIGLPLVAVGVTAYLLSVKTS